MWEIVGWTSWCLTNFLRPPSFLESFIVLAHIAAAFIHVIIPALKNLYPVLIACFACPVQYIIARVTKVLRVNIRAVEDGINSNTLCSFSLCPEHGYLVFTALVTTDFPHTVHKFFRANRCAILLSIYSLWQKFHVYMARVVWCVTLTEKNRHFILNGH